MRKTGLNYFLVVVLCIVCGGGAYYLTYYCCISYDICGGIIGDIAAVALFKPEIPRYTGPPSTMQMLFSVAYLRCESAEVVVCGLLFAYDYYYGI